MVTALALLQLATAVLVLAVAYRRGVETWAPSPGRTVLLSLGWVAVVTWPFWIAGDASFAATNSELDYPLTLIPLVDAAKDRFFPALAGGVDTYGEIFSGAYVSLEYALLKALPLALAHGVHKVAVVTVSFGGMFLLARSFGVVPMAALAAAALFSVSHERIVLITWVHGLGFALPPLAAWLMVCRLGRPAYWPTVMALTGLVAVSTSPTHSFPVIVFTVLAVAVLRGNGAWRRVMPGLILMFVLVIANWHESLFAKALIGPWTARGQFLPPPTRRLDYLIILAGLAGLTAWIASRGVRSAIRPAFALVIAGPAGPALMLAVQALPILRPLAALNLGNLQMAFASLAPLLLALGLAGLKRPRLATAVGLAVAAAQAVWLQAYIPLVWLSEGGLSQVTSATTQLRQAPWRPQEPVRVASVTYRLPANAAVLAGFDSADGGFALALKSQERFWTQVVSPHPQEADSGFLGFQPVLIDWKCCPTQSVGDFADLALLRAANVGFLFSRVALTGEGLTQIAGPETPSIPTGGLPAWDRFRILAHELFNPAGVRVYRIDGAWPRVFPAARLETVDDDIPDALLFARLRSAERVAVVRQKDRMALDLVDGEKNGLVVRAVRQNGATMIVEIDAPEGGLIVVNNPWLPFWHARAEGRDLPLVPVNGIHMAVAVTPGTRVVEFRYERPLLREVLAARWGDHRPAK